MSATDDRAEFTEGLRALADLLDTHDEVPLPYHGTNSEITFQFLGYEGTEKAALAAAVRAFPGRLEKNDPAESDYDKGTYVLSGALRGLRVRFVAYRDAVCERVVVGSETVVREVPDPDALALVPTTTVTETVETVEWRCHSLLTPEPALEPVSA